MTLELCDQIIHINCRDELHILIDKPDDKIWLKLIKGSAEIFGSDLHMDKEYEFTYFSSVAIFSWTGCTLNLRKETSKETKFNIRASTQVPKMKDLHDLIEGIRMNADNKDNTDFPITLLAGPSDAGKSTLCRFLLNYAVKCNRQPIFVDLDVGQSSLSICGTFGILPIYEQSNANGKFNEQELCAYYFGYKSPGHNMALYKLLLQKVRKSLDVRVKRSHMKSSGILIDTCGWIDDGGYRLIKEIIKMLNINMVLVLSKKSLYHKLKSDISEKTKLLFINRFNNVHVRNRTVRINNRNNSIYQYFYGSYGQLRPYTIKINFKELQIFKVDLLQRSNVIPVLIEPNILHQVLALSYADTIEKILLTSVYGFINIVELNMESEIATILSPQPGPLPTNYLIMGDIVFSQNNF